MNPVRHGEQGGPWEEALAKVGRRLDADADLREDLGRLFLLLAAEAPSGVLPGRVQNPVDEVDAAGSGEAVVPEQGGEHVIGADGGLLPSEPPPTAAMLSELVEQFRPRAAGTVAMPHPLPMSPPARAADRVIRKRLLLKLEALSIAMRRARLREEGQMVEGAAFADVQRRAKELPDCHLWMCDRVHEARPAEDWRTVLHCFRALTHTHSLTVRLSQQAGDAQLEPVLGMLAAACSATRLVVDDVFGTEDSDQNDVFSLLNELTATRRIYVSRHMRLNDPADPGGMPALVDRAAAMEGDLEAAEQAERDKKKARQRFSYELKRAIGAGEREAVEHWEKAMAAAEELIAMGVKEDSADWRSLLLPHLEQMPAALERIPAGFRSVLRAIDEWEAMQEQSAAEVPRDGEETEEVREVREALAGSCLVVIGGDRRELARQQLMRAFSLADLNWVETRPHEPTRGFEPAIARSDVKVVLLAIRWTSHQFGDVRAYCEAYGKKLVRLPAGYGVNRVAHEIRSQGALD